MVELMLGVKSKVNREIVDPGMCAFSPYAVHDSLCFRSPGLLLLQSNNHQSFAH